MKRLWMFSVLTAVCLVLTAQGAGVAADLKIGYVNLAGVFEQYNKIADANERLEKKKEQVRLQLEELRQMQQQNVDQLSEKGRQEQREKVSTKQEEVRAKTMEIRAEEERILREVLQDIETVTGELRKKNEYSYILDQRSIIVGPEEDNLTAQVVEMLNQRYKK